MLGKRDKRIPPGHPFEYLTPSPRFTSTMKSLIAAAIFLAASVLPIFAEEPTIREAKDWIIISGTGFEEKGPLPWTRALRKDTILSLSIRPDPYTLFPSDDQGNRQEKKFHDTPKDQIPKLGAVIDITIARTRGSDDSSNVIYTIEGLTNATAPAFLEKILELIQKPEK